MMDIVERLRAVSQGYVVLLNDHGVYTEAADEIERLREDRERLQYALMEVCNSLDDSLPAIITKNIVLAALGLLLRGMKEGE